MEESILLILKDTALYHENQETYFNRCAYRITELFSEFIKWKDFDDYDYMPSEVSGNYKSSYKDEAWTLEEVYQYWLNNVKK